MTLDQNKTPGHAQDNIDPPPCEIYSVERFTLCAGLLSRGLTIKLWTASTLLAPNTAEQNPLIWINFKIKDFVLVESVSSFCH